MTFNYIKESPKEETTKVDAIYQEIVKNVFNQINKENISQAEISTLRKSIDNLRRSLAKTNWLINESKRKIVAYITMLTIIITIPTIALIKTKNTPRERVYRTYKEVHSTMEKEDDFLDYDYTYLNPNKLVEHYVTYEPLSEDAETVIVRTCDPWVVEGIDAKRKITTYKFDNAYYEVLVATDNLESILANMPSEVSYEYVYQNTLSKYEKEYPERIYEIIKSIQDTQDYIEKGISTEAKVELICALLADLLLELCLVDTNHGLLIESMIIEIDKLITNKKVNEKQVAKLKLLRAKYRAINPISSSYKVRKRRK